MVGLGLVVKNGKMLRNILIIGFLILLVIPFIYSAEEYGSGTFSLGTHGSGEESSGGGSYGECTYEWECTNWSSECPKSEIQERICANKGTCTGTTGIPNQTQMCEYTSLTEPLFDIFLTLYDKDKEICAGEKIKTNIRLENLGKTESLDVFMTYWILDEDNALIVELKDTRSIKDEINFDIAIEIPNSTTLGTYFLYARINYDENKTAIAGESFEIVSETQCEFSSKSTRVIIVTGIFLILIILIFFITRNIERKPLYVTWEIKRER